MSSNRALVYTISIKKIWQILAVPLTKLEQTTVKTVAHMPFAYSEEHLMHTQTLILTHTLSYTQPQIHANQLVSSLLWEWRECVKRNCKLRRKCFLSDLRTRFSTDCEIPNSSPLYLYLSLSFSFLKILPPPYVA